MVCIEKRMKMAVKFFMVLLFCLSYLYGEDTNTTIPTKPAYVNIVSNVKETKVYINGDLIGETPIKRYQVIPNKDYFLYAMIDKKFYKEDISQTINIKVTTIPDIILNFEQAEAIVFLVGEDGELYINGKFEKVLHARNRVFTIGADKNIEFRIRNGYKEIVFYKDIYANSFNEIKYKLIEIPLDIRLYTQTINNEMWEDTKEAANTAIEWEEAKKYCEKLTIGGFTNWDLPTIGQLKNLHENHKDEIYNGFGGVFYWSSNTSKDDKDIWQYAEVLNVENSEIERSVQEIKTGRVRCVRTINESLPISTLPVENNETVEIYDANITQDLKRFLLK
jgi:hypothetical protein